MPIVEAWIPVTAFVRVEMDVDEDDPFFTMSQKDKIERLRSKGDTEAQLCPECQENIEMDAAELDYIPEDDLDGVDIRLEILD